MPAFVDILNRVGLEKVALLLFYQLKSQYLVLVFLLTDIDAQSNHKRLFVHLQLLPPRWCNCRALASVAGNGLNC